MGIATLDRLINDFKALPLDDKEYAPYVIKKQLASLFAMPHFPAKNSTLSSKTGHFHT